MKTKILLIACGIALFASISGWTQVDKFLRVEVPFAFTVGERELPAGRYDFSREPLNNAIKVTSVSGGPSSSCLVKARVWSGIHTTPRDSHLVFDQEGDKYTFSELWIPGTDGFLLYIGKGERKYKVIAVP
jgi:hypothetical protein